MPRYEILSGKIVTSLDMKSLDDVLGLEFKGDYVYLNSQYFGKKIPAFNSSCDE